MRYFEFDIKDYFPQLSDMPRGHVKAYIPEVTQEIDINASRPSMLIFPGGAYKYTSEREAEPIALYYLSKGFNAFVLYYAVEPAKYPCSHLQAMAMVELIRKNKEQWNCNGQVCVIGFSAGGHLAMCTSNPDMELAASYSLSDVRPDAAILCYPVITSKKGHTHGDSFDALCNNEQEKLALSGENRVSKDTPPTFIWMTSEDPLVSVTNALIYAAALKEHGLKFELHVFPDGCHGLACCNKTTGIYDFFLSPYCERWMEMSAKFLERSGLK